MSMVRDDGLAVFSDWSEVASRLRQQAEGRSGAFAIEVAGKACFVKVAAGGVYSWPRILVLAPVIRLLAGAWPDTRPLRRNGRERLAFEARRLRSLHDAGIRVPEVKLHLDQVLVVESVGERLDSILSRLDDASRMDLVRSAAVDLAALHVAGHWHGGAQLRNVTLHEDHLYRIDFEEDLEGVLPLPLRQAMDGLLAAFSIAHCRALGRREVRLELTTRFLSSWSGAMEQEPVCVELLRVRRWLAGLGWLAERLHRIHSRDLEAFRILSEAIRHADTCT